MFGGSIPTSNNEQKHANIVFMETLNLRRKVWESVIISSGVADRAQPGLECVKEQRDELSVVRNDSIHFLFAVCFSSFSVSMFRDFSLVTPILPCKMRCSSIGVLSVTSASVVLSVLSEMWLQLENSGTSRALLQLTQPLPLTTILLHHHAAVIQTSFAVV